MSKAEVGAIYCSDVLSEVSVHTEPVLHGNSTAAQRNCEELRPGKIRHIGEQNVFIKKTVEAKTVALQHTEGKQNPMDILTKFLTWAILDAYLDIFELNANGHYFNQDQTQLKPGKLQRVSDIK
eukprot:6023695-Alexandrium_andersonii.AAC.1